MELDHKAAAWAERRHGLIRADVAARIGFSRRQIGHRLETGRWALVRERVYRIGGSPPTWEQQLLAATWTSGRDAVASHDSALRVWGLGRTDALELTTDRAHQVRVAGVVNHRSIALPEDDRTRRNHIPVTSVARTIVDVSGRMSVDQLGSLIDAALRARLLRLDDLARCAKRLRPARGRRLSVVHSCLALRLPGYDPGDSDLETRAVRALIHGGLPAPRQGYRVRLDGHAYVLDLAYPELMIAIELDGWSVHRWRTAFDRDRSRKNRLEVHGWMVLQFTSKMPDDEIVDMTRRAIVLRSRTVGDEKPA